MEKPQIDWSDEDIKWANNDYNLFKFRVEHPKIAKAILLIALTLKNHIIAWIMIAIMFAGLGIWKMVN